MKNDMLQQMEGYGEILRDLEAARRYGTAYTEERGKVAEVIDRLHPKRLTLKVTEVIRESEQVRTFRLAPEKGWLPPFIAGQYITLFVKTGGIRTARPYSISSPPSSRAVYDITVQRVPGGLVSGFLFDRVQPGDRLETSGPEGHFYRNPVIHPDALLCIAGGSGITPFMSMIREMTSRGLGGEICLLYGARSPEHLVFHQELTKLAADNRQLTYVPVLEKAPDGFQGEAGFITEQVIGRHAAGKEPLFLLCGPQGLYDFCLPSLHKLGVPLRRIRREIYGAPLDITASPGWPQKIAADETFQVTCNGKVFPASAGEPLIRALEAAGLAVPSLCRGGQCSMCRVKVLTGEVYEPPGTPVRASDRRWEWVHSCVSFPLTDLELTF